VRGTSKAPPTASTRRHDRSGGKLAKRLGAVTVSLLSLVLVFAALLGVFASSAFAEKTREFTGTSFGPEGIGGSESFKSLQAVAVDQSDGSVYVFDAGEGGKIYKFDSAGNPVDFSGLSGNVIEEVGGTEDFGAFAENEIAIAPPGSPGGTAGDIYFANNSFGALQVYGADGIELEELETAGETCGVATDSAGHLFVGVFGSTIAEYTPSANPPIAADETGVGTAEVGLCNVAVDGLGNVYASNFGGNATAKLEGLSDPSPTLFEPGGSTLATDSTNELYLDRGSSVALFTSSGDPDGSFGAPGLAESRGLAIGTAAETAYVNNGSTEKVDLYGSLITLPDATTEAATEVGAESATLHGTISAAGGPEADCEFQLTTKEEFDKEGFAGATSVPCDPEGPFNGSGVEAVSAEVGELGTGTTYFFRLIGSNVNGSNPDQASKDGALSFLTLGPSIVDSAAKEVSASTAKVTGLINPNGEEVTYHFDYGPTEAYGSSAPIPDAAVVLPVASGRIEAGSATVHDVKLSQGAFAVGQEIVGEGIKAGALVTDVKGETLTLSKAATSTSSGVSLTSTTAAVFLRLKNLESGTQYHFRLVATGVVSTRGPDGTFSTLSQDLPSGRAYEMVSPVKKIGEVFAPEPRESLGGACSLECLPGGGEVMMPMQATADGEALVFESQPLSTDLAPSGNEYLARRSGGGWAAGSVTPPLASSGATDAFSGFKAFSADLSRGVLFQSDRVLSPEAPQSEAGQAYNDLYLWEEGSPPSLRPLVTAEPPHRDAAGPGATNAFELSFGGANSGSAGAPAFQHLIFEANDALTQAVPETAPAAPEVEPGRCGGFPGGDCNLYEWSEGRLRLVNVLPGNEAAASHSVIGSGRRLIGSAGSGGLFTTQVADVDHAISADGKRIFWSDESGQVYVRIEGKETLEIQDPGQFLTASADGSKVLLKDGCLYSVAAESCEAQLSGSPAAFFGIAGASEDLSRIYFVDTEALAPGATAGSCNEAISTIEKEEEKEGHVPPGRGCNLYVYDHGSVAFIATLNELDNNFGLNGNYGSWKASPSDRTAQVTPDGRFLVFMSFARLEAGDNRVAVGGCKGAPVHGSACLEVYEYDLNAESLMCVSCNPSMQGPLVGGSNLSLILAQFGGSFEQPENLLAGGQGKLFFESQDALSPNDTNGGVQDVYEWTPSGVGSCAQARGCLSLVSSGHSADDSMFLTATPSGSDAFLVTREQLLPQDEDELLDVYDARLGGGIPPGGVAPCGGEACKGQSSPAPQQPGAASAAFSGPGNQKPPRRKHKHKQRHGRKHHGKKKRSSHHEVRTANGKRGGVK
jgi:hypothetical protein